MNIHFAFTLACALCMCAASPPATSQQPARPATTDAARHGAPGDMRALFDTLERFKRSPAYASMPASDRQDILTILSAPLTDFRPVMLGASASAQFLKTHPFFEVPGSGETLSSSEEDAKVSKTNSCTGGRREGKLSNYMRVAYPNSEQYGVVDLRYKTVLGGLINTGGTYSSADGPQPVDLAIEKIHAVQGQPFPAEVGKRFGILYAQRVDIKDNIPVIEDRLLMCATTGARRGGFELTCLQQTSFGSQPAQLTLSRNHFSTRAGCSLDAGDYAKYEW